MGAVTSRPAMAVKQRQDPVLRRFEFGGGTLVTTQVAPSSTKRFKAESQCVVRFGDSVICVDRRNACEALEFAGYLAKQAKLVLDGRAPEEAGK